MTSPSPDNDGYEPIDQIIIGQERQLPNTTTTTTDDNNEHDPGSETAEQNDNGSNVLSYYNAAHDPEDDTAVHQHNARRNRHSTDHSLVLIPNHYQDLLLFAQRSGQGEYQDLCPDTREHDRVKRTGNYATLGVPAVQEYQGLNRSVPFEDNQKNDCYA